jgi:hypothetical protein
MRSPMPQRSSDFARLKFCSSAVRRTPLASSRITWVLHGDAAVVALPASPERVERALRSLRGAPLLTGGRGRRPLDVAAAARLAAGVGDLLLAADLSLIELNPVFVHEQGAVAVDAVAA